MRFHFALLITALILSQALGAGMPVNSGPGLPKGKIAFTENKGQVHDQDYRSRPDVLYGTRQGDFSIHIRNNGVSYQLYRVDKWKELESHNTTGKYRTPEQQTIFRVDLNWIGCNKELQRKVDDVFGGYDNYYLENCNSGALQVKSYEGVWLLNVYKGIDLHYYSRQGDVKHDYIVAPHANYRQIRLEVKGAEVQLQSDGSVVLTTPLGKIREGAPIVFQAGRKLKSRWKVQDNVLSFEIQGYDPSLELIIDPITRLWSTYYGGTGSYDGPYDCATDAEGNVYICGYTDSNTGTAMATSGSHQSTYAGGTYDAFMAKFNATGIRLWGTYYGGSATDEGLGCAVDLNGDVYLAGSSTSTAGIATPGSHKQFSSTNAGYDAFLVKFNPAGVRIWGTYYGEYCQGTAVATDALGNVYLAGDVYVGATGTTVATAGAHQTSHNGSVDAFLVKFDSTGSRIWGTYHGGANDEQVYSCATDPSGNIYFSGRSRSASSGTMMTTPGSHQPVFGGGVNMYDAFLVKFSSAGTRQWSTFYGGTGNEFGFACATDLNGNVYLGGSTDTNTGSSTLIATPGGFQPAAGGLSFYVFSGFLAKFDAAGVRLWGTYYGGASSGTTLRDCATNALGEVFVAGTLASNSGTFYATPGSHQTNHAGILNAYLAKFDANGARLSSTYYGGTDFDYGAACAVSPVGHVYLLGTATSSNGIVFSSGVTHKSTISGQNEAFLVRFETCDTAPSMPVAVTAPATVCAGAVSVFTSAIPYGATYYAWSLPPAWSGASFGNTISVMPGASGVVTVVAGNPCGVSPQRTLSVVVNSPPTVTVNSGAICSGESFTMVPGGGISYTFSSGSAVVSPTASTIFTVTGVNAAGCTARANSLVGVNPLPTITVNSGIICVGQSFTIIPTGAINYTFSAGPVVSPTTSTSYSVLGSSAAGCLSSSAAVSNVTVSPTPIPTVVVNSGSICVGQSFSMTLSGANSYTVTGGSPVVSPTITTSFTVRGTSAAGCLSSNLAVSVVTVNPLPKVVVSAEPPDTICAGESVTLTASGAGTYTFSPGGPGNGFTVSPVVTTTYMVTGESTEGCKSIASFVQVVDECLAIQENLPREDLFSLVPNPASREVTLRMSADSFEVEFTNSMGQIVYSARMAEGVTRISIADWPAGVYFVRAGAGSNARVSKLLIE